MECWGRGEVEVGKFEFGCVFELGLEVLGVSECWNERE